MPRAERVGLAFACVGKAAYAAALPQGFKFFPPPGQNFVHVGLMPHVPNYFVPLAVNVMQRDGQFHNPQVARQMPAVTQNDVNKQLPDFLAELRQLVYGKFFQIVRAIYFFKHYFSLSKIDRNFASLMVISLALRVALLFAIALPVMVTTAITAETATLIRMLPIMPKPV